MDRYCADNYSHSTFIAGDMKLYEKYMKVNKALFDRYNCHPEQPKGSEGSSSERFFTIAANDIQRASEKISCQWFENWAKNYQIKKIEKDPRTKKYPNLIVYNDSELRFHPPSQKLRRTGPSKSGIDN
jgi:hypothetical protein